MIIINNDKSYQDVRVGTREEESLETLSEDHEWLCRCDVEQKVVPHVGEGNWERQFTDCRESNGRYF